MTQIRSQDSVRRFYTAAIAQGTDTAEALNAAISSRCRAVIDDARREGIQQGLDLGYGMGKHTLAMLEAGLRVMAIDQVPPQHLAAAVAEHGLPAAHLRIRQCQLETFTPDEDFGLVIAKDVLHYLGRDHIERILTALADCAGAAVHHLEVFCDIWRITGGGTPVVIEGEADYRTADFIALTRRLYRGWDLEITQDPHVERDATTDQPYFTATRVIATARHPHPLAARRWRSGA